MSDLLFSLILQLREELAQETTQGRRHHEEALALRRELETCQKLIEGLKVSLHEAQQRSHKLELDGVAVQVDFFESSLCHTFLGSKQ